MLKEINQQVISENNNESSGKDNSPAKNRIVDSDDEINSNVQVDSDDDLKERMHAVSNSVQSGMPDRLNSVSSFDAQEFLFQKRQSLDRFFINVYEKFSVPPYSLQFYLSLPKFMVRQDSVQDFYFELMRKTLKNVTDDEIDLLLYYDTENALSIVQDLIEKQQVTV
jgi:hypothetical protein